MNQIPSIITASVKVMRSFDYCHFEVVLGTADLTSPEEVDELRKTAARLADKAVEQYKIAKRNAEIQRLNSDRCAYRKAHIEAIAERPEGERAPEEKAELKEYQDAAFRASRHYDYEDEWEQDYEE